MLVNSDDVEQLRADELGRLGVYEALNKGGSRSADHPTTSEELSRLRQENLDLREALRLSLVIEAARADQLRLLLADAQRP